jgi:hypothetical protein
MWGIKSKENRISELISKADMVFTILILNFKVMPSSDKHKEGMRKKWKGSFLSTRSCPEIVTGSIDWAQQVRNFYMKTETAQLSKHSFK